MSKEAKLRALKLFKGSLKDITILFLIDGKYFFEGMQLTQSELKCFDNAIIFKDVSASI
jgi:hypothetical protein